MLQLAAELFPSERERNEMLNIGAGKACHLWEETPGNLACSSEPRLEILFGQF
jgi:hypothetical protein